MSMDQTVRVEKRKRYVYVYEGAESGTWWVQRRARNGQVLATSEKPYRSKSSAREAAERDYPGERIIVVDGFYVMHPKDSPRRVAHLVMIENGSLDMQVKSLCGSVHALLEAKDLLSLDRVFTAASEFVGVDHRYVKDCLGCDERAAGLRFVQTQPV